MVCSISCVTRILGGWDAGSGGEGSGHLNREVQRLQTHGVEEQKQKSPLISRHLAYCLLERLGLYHQQGVGYGAGEEEGISSKDSPDEAREEKLD